MSQHKENPFFRQIYLFLTHECPLKCKYCYVDRSKHFDDMSYDTIKQVMEVVRPRYKGGRGIVFFGGEPLLRVDLIERTVKEYAHTMPGGIGGVVTSATVNMDKFFPIYRDYELDMQISYDGLMHNRTRGRKFDFGALDPYFELKEKRFQLRKTVSDANIDTLFDDYLFGKELHINKNVSFDYAIAHQKEFSSPFHDKLYHHQTKIWNYIKDSIENDRRTYIPMTLVKDLYHLKEYIGTNKPFYSRIDSCEVGNILVVDSDGDCYPCTMLSQVGKEFKIGNVYEEIDLSINTGLRESAICKCDYSPVCGGGCRWERYHTYGKEDMMRKVVVSNCRTLHIKYTTAMNFWDSLKDDKKDLIEMMLRNYSKYQKMTFDFGMYRKAHDLVNESIEHVDEFITCN